MTNAEKKIWVSVFSKSLLEFLDAQKKAVEHYNPPVQIDPSESVYNAIGLAGEVVEIVRNKKLIEFVFGENNKHYKMFLDVMEDE
jgi:hypothetical protein